jgi:hypothetical protein
LSGFDVEDTKEYNEVHYDACPYWVVLSRQKVVHKFCKKKVGYESTDRLSGENG